MGYLLIFFSTVLFALNVYIPEKASYYKKFFNKKKFNIKIYTNVNQIDLNNSFAIVPSNYISQIISHRYKILAPLEVKKEYILSHIELEKIKDIANGDLSVKILFSVLDNNISFKKGSLKDFLKNRIDAIVLNKNIYGFFKYDLKDFGIEFNKYYLIAEKNFIVKHIDLSRKIIENFEESCYFKPKIVYKSLVLYSLYEKYKINFNKILYENYIDDQYNGKKLKVAVTPNWPPFNFIEKGELKGIGVDFWRLLAKKANLKYEFILINRWADVLKAIKDEKADLTITTSETEERKKYAVFTKPYMKFPLALVCRKNLKKNNLYTLKIGVGKDFTAEKLMKKFYPDIKLIEKENTMKVLKDVEKGNLDCALDVMPVLIYLVNKNHILNVTLYKKLPVEFKLQIMIRKDLIKLRDKLNEVIDTVSPEEKKEILSKYLSVTYEINSVPKKNFLIVVTVLIILILILIYKYYKIRKIANYDKLTQIYNRNVLNKEIKKLLKKGKGSIIYFDIDYFKNINDTYGHEKGDLVLRELAEIVKAHIRKTDIFGRWGGEEFLIILPETDYEDALKVAEKLRKIIENHNFGDLKITVSFGVTSVKKGDTPESLFERVDKALYEAKKTGRNQVKGK